MRAITLSKPLFAHIMEDYFVLLSVNHYRLLLLSIYQDTDSYTKDSIATGHTLTHPAGGREGMSNLISP